MNAPRMSTRMPARDLALVATFAALIAVLGLIPAFRPLGLEVPITAQTLGVMLAGSLLGARRAALAVITFLLLVAAGLPLLAGGRGGLAMFTGPSAGYFFGWVLGALVIGHLVARRPLRGAAAWIFLANVIGGIAVVYALGIPVTWLVAHKSALPVVAAKALLFVPGDLLKVTAATAITVGVLRGYPQALPPRRAEHRTGAHEVTPSSAVDA